MPISNSYSSAHSLHRKNSLLKTIKVVKGRATKRLSATGFTPLRSANPVALTSSISFILLMKW